MGGHWGVGAGGRKEKKKVMQLLLIKCIQVQPSHLFNGLLLFLLPGGAKIL